MSPASTNRTTTAGPGTAPPLPSDLEQVLRRMRLPYLRGAAPEVLATAKAQRWDPAEVLRVLLGEEVRGRDEATRAMRRKAAGLGQGGLGRCRDGRVVLAPGGQRLARG